MNNVLNNSVTVSTDIAFDFANETVCTGTCSSFESAQKPTAHSGSHVNKSTFEKWTEKFPWLKNMPGAKRHTKVLTNVWGQVFKSLAYVDTMIIMNTKMLADTQESY